MRKLASYCAALLLCFGLCAQEYADSGIFLDAVADYADGGFDRAREKFLRLHEACPSDDAVRYYLGMSEFALKDMEAAEKHLSMAVRADSSNAWYLHALANLYNTTGERGKFAALGEKLVKMLPSVYDNPYMLTVLGDSKFAIRQDSLALSYYERALEMEPEYAPAELMKLEVLRFQGKYPPFFVTLDHFLRNTAVRADIKSDYLESIMDNMDSKFYWVWGEQLGKLVDLCLEMHPDDPKSHLLKMRIFMIKGDWEAALGQCLRMADVARAAGDKDNLVQAYSVAGDICYQQGDKKNAYRYYELTLEVDPSYAPVLNNYAYYLSEEKKQLRKALKMSAKAIEIEPDNATYLDTYGWILHLLRRPEEAKPYFKHAMIYGGKESAVVLEHYSKVLEALGEKELASYYKTLSDQKKEKQ